MSCFECGWPRLSRTRDGEHRCPRCGTRGKVDKAAGKTGDEPSKTVKIFTGFFAVWGLLFPFLVPIIIKISLANP